jgi:single-strand DNA-binding protein
MNNITIVGRMTDDPYVRKVNIGGVETSVCNFYVAVDEGFGAKKNTEFFHVSAWRGAADAIGKYMGKGREITVSGAVHLETFKSKILDSQTKTYVMDPATGKPKEEMRTVLSIPRTTVIEFLGGSNGGQKFVDNEPVKEDDLPPFPVSTPVNVPAGVPVCA